MFSCPCPATGRVRLHHACWTACPTTTTAISRTRRMPATTSSRLAARRKNGQRGSRSVRCIWPDQQPSCQKRKSPQDGDFPDRRGVLGPVRKADGELGRHQRQCGRRYLVLDGPDQCQPTFQSGRHRRPEGWRRLSIGTRARAGQHCDHAGRAGGRRCGAEEAPAVPSVARTRWNCASAATAAIARVACASTTPERVKLAAAHCGGAYEQTSMSRMPPRRGMSIRAACIARRR